jgi:hypothetical protein
VETGLLIYPVLGLDRFETASVAEISVALGVLAAVATDLYRRQNLEADQRPADERDIPRRAA